MQRAQRAAKLLISVLLAMGIAFVAAAPASAIPVPVRGDGSDNAVIFVHGFDPDDDVANTDCAEYWSNALAQFGEGWRGTLATFGYYSGGDNCDYKYNGTRGTSITTVAKALANYIYDVYTSDNKKVDVVAHSMGGLVIRSALYNVQQKTPGFPPRLFVEDVVTLGTPHDGANAVTTTLCKFAFENKQCSQMTPGSDFLADLPETPSNGSDLFRTEWDVISSYGDSTTGGPSGVGVNASYKLEYAPRSGIDHSDLKHVWSGTHRARYWHASSGQWTSWSDNNSAPLQQAFVGAFFTE